MLDRRGDDLSQGMPPAKETANAAPKEAPKMLEDDDIPF
jgi:hypothetical protein